MAKRLKATHRTKAVALLAQGKPIEEVVRYIQRYHPEAGFSEVEKAYFPPMGAYAISSLEGKPRNTALKKLRLMQYCRNTFSERMKELHKDPEFEEKVLTGINKYWTPENRQLASERMKKLNDDPNFKKKMLAGLSNYWTPENRKLARKQMKERRKDSEFEEKRLAVLARYWERYRSSISEEARKLGYIPAFGNVAGDRKLIPATTRTPLTKLQASEREKAILSALKTLTKEEADAVVARFYDMRNPEEVDEAVLNRALKKLSQHPGLSELL